MTYRTPPRFRVLHVLGVVAGVAACSGDDGKDTPATTSPSPDTSTTTPGVDSPDTSSIDSTPPPTATTGDSATAGGLAITAGPEILEPATVDVAPLARELTVSTDVPTTLVVRLDDGDRTLEVAFPATSTDHRVPLLGMPADDTVEVEIELTDEGGGSLVVSAGQVVTPPPPSHFPDIHVYAHDPDRMEPGYTFGSLNGLPDATYLVAFDDRLRLVWWWDGSGGFGDVRVHSDGTIVGDHDDMPTVWSFLGEELVRYTADPKRPGNVVPTPYYTTHHEVYPLDDGSFWTLCYGTTQVPDFPRAENDPTNLQGPAQVEDNCVAHIAADGTVLAEWWMADLLDTTKIGFDSLKPTPRGADWVHLNGLVPTDDGGVIVSARHLDAVIKVSASGDLQWILGDHAGWSKAWQPYLLTPVGTLSWPYHQHAPMLDDDGTLWLHDNHNNGRTPYTPGAKAEPEVTRLVGYRIDDKAMTVEQVHSYGDAVENGPLFNAARGDADWLPQTGHIFGTWSAIQREADGSNTARGLGDDAVRLIEVDPVTGETVLDIRLASDRAASPKGWLMYRAEREPSLYAADVVVTIIE